MMFGKEKPPVNFCRHFTDVRDLSSFYNLNCFFLLTLLAQISHLVCESIQAGRIKTVLASSGLKQITLLPIKEGQSCENDPIFELFERFGEIC